MLTATPYIYTMFKYIVADAAIRADMAIHYEHGHLLEIVNTLRGMGSDPVLDPQRYPCVCLLQDIDEDRNISTVADYKVNLNLIIVGLSEPNDVAEQRLTKVYIPVLYPIYEALQEAIIKSGYFKAVSLGDIPHGKTDRMYWGKKGLAGNEGNIFGDWVDAIEIQNLNLIVKNKSQNCNI